MDSIGYAALTRQSGLLREMATVANNIANMSTGGYRRESLVFAEHVAALEPGEPSLSQGAAVARMTDTRQGPLTQTGAPFDLAIEGEGYFLVDTPQGRALTRAGSFTPDATGNVVTPDGHALLDAGGSPVFAPQGAAVAIGADGTVSADGIPIGQIGLWQPTDPRKMVRGAGTLFRTEDVQPAEGGRIFQGFLEGSNVDPVAEIARMIEVQRGYELGQRFLDREDERIRGVIQIAVKL
jgi:flagellar basal-body rod protein FlgF